MGVATTTAAGRREEAHGTKRTQNVRVRRIDRPEPENQHARSGTQAWCVLMQCFQNKSADRVSMKRIMKQLPQCMSFNLMFPRLGKVFNYYKMIGSHARW